MFTSKPPFRPAGRCSSGFSPISSVSRTTIPQKTSVSPTKRSGLAKGSPPSPANKHSYLKRSHTAAPQPRSCSPIKRHWPLTLPLEQALAALKPQLFLSSRLRLGPDTDQLCYAYISALSCVAPELGAGLKSGQGWSALQLLGRKPGKLVSVAKTLLRDIRTQRIPAEKSIEVSEIATKALAGKLEDTELVSALASYLRLLPIETANSSLIASSLSPSSHRQPSLRTSRLSFTSPRRPHSLQNEPPDPKLESLFCHFLKQGLRDGDFPAPESYEDLNMLFRGFSTSMRYNEEQICEKDIELFQQALKLETVQQWAKLYQMRTPVDGASDTWLGRSINREKAKVLSWSFI